MEQDPTPGDPDLIQGITQRYRDIGDAAERALNVLKKDGAVSRGRGAVMDKLNEKIGDDLPDKLSKTMTSYHDAAQAYTDYMPRLREAQDTFDRAVDQAREAAPQAGQTPPPQLGQDATDEDKSQARRAQEAIDEGRSRLSAAKGLADQAKSMRESAQRQCEDVLDRAAREAIPERNIFQKIGDFFKEFPFVQVLLGLLIAALSVFFPIAGALLGGVLFSVGQIGAIASGNFSLGEFLTGLAGLIPGAGLFKAGGAAAKAGAGAAGKLLPAGAKAVGGSVKSVGSAFDAGRKVIGPLADSVGGKIAGEAAKEFGKDAATEAADQAINGKPLDLGDIAEAGGLGAAGVVGGAALAGAGKKAGKGGGELESTPPGRAGLGTRISGLAGSTGGRIVGGAAKEFGKDAASEAAGQVGAGEPLDFGEIARAGGLGALGGAAAGVAAARPGTSNAPGRDSAGGGATARTPLGTTSPVPPTSRPSAQLDPRVDPTGVTGLAGNSANPNGVPQFRTDDHPLFRDDTRLPVGPDGIFTTGFAPRDPVNSGLTDFVTRNTPSAFVSTTRREDLNFLGSSTAGGQPVFRFRIQAPGGIDVNATLGTHANEAQREVAFPGGIRPQNVEGAHLVLGGGGPFMPVTVGPFVPNPNFRPDAPNPTAPAAVRPLSQTPSTAGSPLSQAPLPPPQVPLPPLPTS